jgi:hypothetical protein
VEFYSQGGRSNPDLDSEVRARNFTTEEKRALVAFLRCLSGKIQEGAPLKVRRGMLKALPAEAGRSCCG